MLRCFSLAWFLLVLVPVHAYGDEVVLKGGGRLSGRIVSRTALSVEIDVGPGTITVPMTSVERIEERRSVLHDYQERAAVVKAGDRDGWLRLATWSASQGLNTQARHAYARVLALDPGQAEANLALGRVLVDGRWMTEDESHRTRGFLQFEGRWVTPAEHEGALREREADRAAERARLDGEWRVREAEARAREAEAVAAQQSAGIPLWYGTWGWGSSAWPSHSGGRYRPGGGRPHRPGSTWPPLFGTFPSPSLGMWPSQGLGPWPARPLGPLPSINTVRPQPVPPIGHAHPPSQGRPGPPPGSRPR